MWLPAAELALYVCSTRCRVSRDRGVYVIGHVMLTSSGVQDKLRQKQFFAAAGVPLPDFRGIENAGDLAAAAAEFGFPFMLKSRT